MPITQPISVTSERNELLARLEAWLEFPMLILAFVWLALLVWEFTWGLSPLLEIAGTVIWVIFILNFTVEFILSPKKIEYLKRNWLTALSLIIPALRVFRVVRVLRVVRAARGLRLVKVIGSLNRGMRALGETMSRRGVGYVLALTLIVTLAGAAGMFAFENEAPGSLNSYGEALWWTAMIMTTMGSQDWPQTAEGRILCLFLALYAFAVFGYVTATLASYFIGRDAENENAEIAGAKAIQELKSEIIGLRGDIGALRQDFDSLP